MATCELCGKELRTTQGLRGHKNFVHGAISNSNTQPVAQLATEWLVSKPGQARPATMEDFERLLNRSKPSSSGISIPEQLGKIRDAVSKLTDAASKLSKDLDTALKQQ